MKLLDNTTTIEQIGNVTQENTFKMKSSRKAFQILSDLYSDKPLAIVRELGCNATDSMVMAGKKDQPFHIHLPNALEPWLTIQDFGTGITHENIYSIYATYFESTKTNSNEQIGCLGLGSKSPFCYTDNFSVTSITDGVKRIYNAYFGADGCPTIALMSTENTTDINGIAIQIPVKPQDFDTFRNAVKKAFRFFDNKPLTSGASIVWDDEKPMFEGKGWRSYDKLGYCESYAIMGGVTYPIESNKMESKYSDMFRKGGLVLFFEMGEIDFTPSREAISYCDDTIKAINNKMAYVQEDFKKRVEEMLAEKDNILEALRMMHSLQHKFAYIAGMTIGKKMTWKGFDVTEPSTFIRNLIKACGNTMTYYKSSYYKQKISETTQIELGEQAKWVWDDGTRGLMTRIKAYCRENAEVKVTLFTEDAFQMLVNNGFPVSQFTSGCNMPKVQRVTKSRNGNTTRATRIKGVFNVYEMGNTDHQKWEPVQLDSNDSNCDIPKYYIIKGNDGWNFNFAIKGITTSSINTKDKLWAIMRFMEIPKDQVVMVSERYAKYLYESQEFSKYVHDNLQVKWDKNAMATCYENSPHTLERLVKNTDFISIPDTNEFKQYIVTLYNTIEKYHKYRDISFLFPNERSGKAQEYTGKCKVTQMLVSKVGRWSDHEICLIVNSIK